MKASKAIIDILKKPNAVPMSAYGVVAAAHKENPGLFKREPSASSAASIMTAVFATENTVHRVLRGKAFFYWVGAPKSAQVKIIKRGKAPPDLGEIIKIAAELKAKTPPMSNAYTIVKTIRGEPAGVVFRNVLYQSLEELVQSLNLRGRQS